MLPEQIESDIALAKKICEGLRSGERECLEKLVTIHNEFFHNFARRRLFRPDIAEDVVQSFWKEMVNGQTICTYAFGSENTATLRTYLVGVLHRRVIDANRKISKNGERHQGEENLQGRPDQAPTPHNGLTRSSSQHLAQRLVNQALLRLSEHSPQDASLVRMHLEGLDYSQMAARLGKSRDAIKKQFSREPTGSLAKFKKALMHLMHAEGLRYEDI
jgi:RNA polymerase sigma-70 factor (ECF subfamily)